MTGTNRPHEAAITDFVDRIEAEDVPSIQRLLVFGSVARGTHSNHSDINVLAIIAKEADVTEVEERLRDIAYNVMLDLGTVFSIHGVSENTFDDRSDHPFFQRVQSKGKQILG